MNLNKDMRVIIKNKINSDIVKRTLIYDTYEYK